MRRLICLIAVALAVTACGKHEQATTATTATAASPRPAHATTTVAAGADVGQAMPAYESKWLDGTTFDLASRRDKVVLLNLWATWCGPCRYEIPELQAAHTKYASRGFEVIGVSLDEGAADAVKQFVDEHKMTYPIAIDSDGKIAGLLDASVLPTTVLIDRSGRIVWKKIGAIMPQDDELTKAIEKAL
jgi:cytochrome c biogenesis protein CcmG/thiol:disulfide interchange protein DsbE